MIKVEPIAGSRLARDVAEPGRANAKGEVGARSGRRLRFGCAPATQRIGHVDPMVFGKGAQGEYGFSNNAESSDHRKPLVITYGVAFSLPEADDLVDVVSSPTGDESDERLDVQLVSSTRRHCRRRLGYETLLHREIRFVEPVVGGHARLEGLRGRFAVNELAKRGAWGNDDVVAFCRERLDGIRTIHYREDRLKGLDGAHQALDGFGVAGAPDVLHMVRRDDEPGVRVAHCGPERAHRVGFDSAVADVQEVPDVQVQAADLVFRVLRHLVPSAQRSRRAQRVEHVGGRIAARVAAPDPPHSLLSPRGAGYNPGGMSTARRNRSRDPKEEAIRRATQLVRSLAEGLRALRERPGNEGGERYVAFLGFAGFGRVDSKVADLHRSSIEALEAVHGRNPNTRLVSPGRAREILGDVLQQTFPRSKAATTVPRATFERRLSKALSAARRVLREPPQTWAVSVRVDGFHPTVLPVALGTVSFHEGTTERGTALAAAIADLEPTPTLRRRWRAPHSIEAENRTRETARKEVAASFTGGAVASLEVRAGDKETAERIGIARVRETLDVINFFSSFLDHPRERQGRAYCAPDGPRESVVWMIRSVTGKGLTWRPPDPGRMLVTAFDPKSPLATECGLPLVDEMLRSEARTDLQQRIVTGLAWAGRAKIEFRPEQAFVLYAIALESLLAKHGARAGVMTRVPLRATQLLGGSREYRKQLHARVERLYDLRNAIVHSGHAADLQVVDVEDMRDLANRALTSMLLHPPYLKFRSVRDFDEWLDDQRLGGQPAKAEGT